ncbi:hypothetical protein D9M71_641180 [compost metagenome]
MDAARASSGQGRPVDACLRNNDGAREPRRSRGRMMGQAFLVTSLAFERSNSPEGAKQGNSGNTEAAAETPLPTDAPHNLAYPVLFQLP